VNRNRNINGNERMGESRNGQSGGLSTDIMKAIHELEFVRVELELYLDTHPGCKVALDYYHQTVDALNELRERYQADGSLLFASGSTNPDGWDWVNEPWPWYRGDEIMKRNERGGGK